MGIEDFLLQTVSFLSLFFFFKEIKVIGGVCEVHSTVSLLKVARTLTVKIITERQTCPNTQPGSRIQLTAHRSDFRAIRSADHLRSGTVT